MWVSACKKMMMCPGKSLLVGEMANAKGRLSEGTAWWGAMRSHSDSRLFPLLTLTPWFLLRNELFHTHPKWFRWYQCPTAQLTCRTRAQAWSISIFHSPELVDWLRDESWLRSWYLHDPSKYLRVTPELLFELLRKGSSLFSPPSPVIELSQYKPGTVT